MVNHCVQRENQFCHDGVTTTSCILLWNTVCNMFFNCGTSANYSSFNEKILETLIFFLKIFKIIFKNFVNIFRNFLKYFSKFSEFVFETYRNNFELFRDDLIRKIFGNNSRNFTKYFSKFSGIIRIISRKLQKF